MQCIPIFGMNIYIARLYSVVSLQGFQTLGAYTHNKDSVCTHMHAHMHRQVSVAPFCAFDYYSCHFLAPLGKPPA